MKNVLVPIDFSENALNAFNYAQLLLEKLPTTFFLLHFDSKVKEDWAEDTRRNLIQFLSIVKSENVNPKHFFEVIAQPTTSMEIVNEIIRAKKIDLIVSAGKGANVATDTFLDMRVVNLIKEVRNVPIVLVPVVFKAEKPRQIVFYSNFKREFVEKELATLIHLVRVWNCHLRIMQVAKDELFDDFQWANKENLRYMFWRLNYSFEKVDDNASEISAIENFVHKEQCDMISLVNHRYNFLKRLIQGDTVKKTAFNSKVPVLLLPELRKDAKILPQKRLTFQG